MPLNISCFVEDVGHRLVVGPLLRKICQEAGSSIQVRFLNATGGKGKALDELRQVKQDIALGRLECPAVLVAAIDGNCEGYGIVKRRVEEIVGSELSVQLVCAVPDPHVERWLLLDSEAFKLAVGRGCAAPDNKCERDRYKGLLRRALFDANLVPQLDGLEFAEAIVAEYNLERAASIDSSFSHFLSDVRAAVASVRSW
ncbi:MAG: hypothetical protein ACREM6_11675 [Vulcanimicrobiaceae bacterium]